MLNPSRFVFQPYWENRFAFYELALKYSCGIEILSFAMPEVLNNPNVFSRHFDSYKEELQSFPGPKSLHGAFIDITPHSPDAKVAATSRDRIRESMRVAAALQCQRVIFHTGINTLIGNPRYYDSVVEAQASFWRNILAESENLQVCLENMWEKRPDMLSRIVRLVDSPRLKLCFDSGHANVFSDISLADWITEVSALVPYMHWNDNLKDRDSELPIGAGSIDWFEMVALVTQLTEHPSIVLEVGNIDSVKRSIAYLAKHNLVTLA